MFLLINMLSRFVTVFLPRRECLLISWLQLLSAVILEPKKIKSITVSIVSPSICHEVMWQDVMILVFPMLSFKPAFPLYVDASPSFWFLTQFILPGPTQNFLISCKQVFLYKPLFISCKLFDLMHNNLWEIIFWKFH